MKAVGRTACLAAMLAASLATRAEQAKLAQQKAVVEADLRALTMALEACALNTTYFVSLETLNDRTHSPTLQPLHDYLNQDGGSWVIRPTDGLFRPTRIDLLAAFNRWQGPYINYQQGQTQTGTLPYDQGSPLDPWGNPYLFYTPMGLVCGDQGAITQEYHGDRFDRPTVACLGPDGVVSNDDVFRQFGSVVQVPGLSSLRGAGINYRPATNDFTAPHRGTLQLRGYHFGNEPGANRVQFGTLDLTPHVSEWTSSRITLTLPDGLTGMEDVTVRVGSGSTNAQRLTILPSAAGDWTRYE